MLSVLRFFCCLKNFFTWRTNSAKKTDKSWNYFNNSRMTWDFVFFCSTKEVFHKILSIYYFNPNASFWEFSMSRKRKLLKSVFFALSKMRKHFNGNGRLFIYLYEIKIRKFIISLEILAVLSQWTKWLIFFWWF